MLAAHDAATRRRLERNLVLVRWFGVAFGLFQFTTFREAPGESVTPGYVRPAGYALIALLAIANALLHVNVGRLSDRQLRRVGVAAFALDIAVVVGVVWLFSYDRHAATWTLLYVLPLEGAVRYQLRGALFPVGLALVSEVARETYRVALLPEYPFFVASVTFRVGIAAIIALVAGIMARSLSQQAGLAEERARAAEDAARREAAARRELSAFHTTILAGVAAGDLEHALQSMVESIGAELGLETLTIALVEDGHLQPKAVYGLDPGIKEIRLRPGEGITGEAWATARPVLAEDVSGHPSYVLTDPSVRAELAVPLRVGDEVLGVLDVESRRPGGLTPASLELMARLADQVALVVNNARALTRQRQALERMQELDQMKSDFVAITSHELRTPLTAIRGFVETLEKNADRLTPEQQAEYLSVIDRQSARLARLVEDLLMVSRIEAGQLQIRPEAVDLGSFAHDIVASFEARDRGRLRLEVHDEGSVWLDPNRVDQVLRNLVHNALKFSRAEQPVLIEVARIGGGVEFAVRDHGIGIPEEQLERIFDRFHQAADSLTREQEGAGLGLYISKRLVEAMGGRITVRSEQGIGSEFRFRVPQPEAPATAPRPREARAG